MYRVDGWARCTPVVSEAPAIWVTAVVAAVLLRLLSTEAATNATVSTSAITLTAACGDGCHPRSVNPKADSPRQRERGQRRDGGHPRPTAANPVRRRGSARPEHETLACSRNAGPMVGMDR